MRENSWPEIRIGDLGEVFTGRTPSTERPEYFGSDFPFITPGDMRQGKYVRATERSVSHEGAELLKRIRLPANSVCVSCIGWQMGEAIMTDRPSFTNQQINTIVPNSKVEPSFLYYSLRPRKQELLALGATTGVRTPILNKSAFCDLKVKVAPLPVQRRIGAILSAYDELMENSQRRIRLLETLACSIYREWFIYFRFPGYEKISRVSSPIGEIPDGWKTAPLSSLVDFAKGRKPAETRADALPGDVKLLLIDSLHGGKPMFTTPAKLVLAESRDTIMVMDGASSCEVTIGASGAVGSTLGRFRTTRPKVFPPHALYRFLEAKAEEFKSKNIGAAIPHANKDYILSQFVALPTEEVAASFHEQLEPIQSTIETLKAQIQNLRQTRDLLLPRLLSGQINLAEN